MVNRRHFLQSGLAVTALSQLRAKELDLHCDVLVVGGGVGGFAAALVACRNGASVILTEETDWLDALPAFFLFGKQPAPAGPLFLRQLSHNSSMPPFAQQRKMQFTDRSPNAL